MTWFVLAALVAVPAIAAFAVPRGRATFLHLAGGGLVYAGERLLAGDDWSAATSGLGVLFLVAGLVSRVLSGRGSSDPAASAALRWQALGVSALIVYALSLDATVTALGLGEEAAGRWQVVFAALWPIVALVGTLPAVMLDLAASRHPRLLPSGARNHAVQSGLAIALGVSLVFPVNYLAAEHNQEWDFSYFRVTKPGGATEALVRNLAEPVEVMLFYPAANEVKEKMLPYFEQLAATSDGKLTVRVVDQPMEPKLSEELAIRDNGYVVFQRPGADGKPVTEKFKLDADLKKARRDLKKLDGTVQKHLTKLTRGKRIAYLLTGHGEASPREENPFLKLADLKTLLRAQNYEVNDFGIDQGSTTEVPEDAAMLIIAGPERALLPAEIDTVKKYVDRGGALMVLLEPTKDRLPEVLGHLGLSAGAVPLAHASKYVALRGGLMDRFNLGSQNVGTHAVTATVAKASTRTGVVMLGAVALSETGSATAASPVKLTPLVRSPEGTWEDLNLNAELDAGEAGKVHVVAMAAEGPETAKYRAVVIGGVSLGSDFLLQRVEGNQLLLGDAARWLVGEEELVGETQSEEDVRIEHTREQDVSWFYGTIFGVPLLTLVAGALFVRSRARKA